jgi:hypothetical protein
MATEERKRCDNLACLCEVALSVSACSEACADGARDARTVVCVCEHVGCRTQTERRLHGEVGRESL